MEFRTPVNITLAPFAIEPRERMLFVGSCFADNIGRRFVDDKFRATVNPYGVMYNPASIMHTVKRWTEELGATDEAPQTAVFTLGTNHVYVLNETGEIVDNCRKRPQRLFTERELSVDECADYLREAIATLQKINPSVRIIITVSPIRYAKYGFHGSQLSKATLLLAADKLTKEMDNVCISPPTRLSTTNCATTVSIVKTCSTLPTRLWNTSGSASAKRSSPSKPLSFSKSGAR